MKDSKQILSESSTILVVSTIITKIISAIFKIPLASDYFLGNVGFGYYSVAHDLFSPFYILAISGLPVALAKITAEFLAKKSYYQVKNNFFTAKKLFIILGFLFSIILAVLSIPLILRKDGIDNIYSILAVVPSVFLCFIISVYRGYFEGFNNMYPSAISKIIEAIVKLVLGLLLSFIVIKTTKNPALAAGVAMLSVSFGTLLSTLYLKIKFKRNNPLDDISYNIQNTEQSLSLKTVFIIAIPFIISSLAASIVSLVDVFTIDIHFANASEEYINVLENMYFGGKVDFNIATYLYGVKSKAFTIYNLIPILTMSLGIAALPVLTQSLVNNDISALKNNTRYILKLLFCVTLPAGIGLFVMGQPIMNLLYSSKELLSGNLLSIYGIAAMFAGVAIPLTTVLQALNFHYKALTHIIIGIIIKIIFNIVLLIFPNINIYSAPLGTLACYFYMTVAFLLIISFKIKKIAIIKIVIKPFAAALLCGVTALIISNLSNSILFIILAILAAGLVYLIFLSIFRTFTKSEIQGLIKFKNC